MLDVLATAGVETVCVDNNSGCKHVCDRTENENLRLAPDGGVLHTNVLNIELVDVAEHYIDSGDSDMLIVLHMQGKTARAP